MRLSRRARALGSLVLLAALAALGAVPVTAQAAVDLTDVGLHYQAAGDRAKNTKVVVFTATITGDEPVLAILLRLEQPSPPPTSPPTSKPAGSCSPSDNRGRVVITCSYPGGLPSGTHVSIVVTLPGDYPIDGGAVARAQGQQSQSPLRTVPGPVELTYDLDVKVLSSGRADAGSVDPDADESPLAFVARVSHPFQPPPQRPSAPTTVSSTSEPALPVTVELFINSRRQHRKCATFSSGFECEVEALKDFDGAHVINRTSFRAAMGALGTLHKFRVDLACRPAAEIKCSNNQTEEQVVFRLAGDSALGSIKAQRLAGVLAGNPPPRAPRRAFQAAAVAPRDRPRRADVAVLRLGRRQRGFSGAPNPLGTEAPGARRCSWLSTRGRRFRKTPIGARRTCDAPLWLPARGTRRWTFRLTKPLPPGRYVVYSRAVTRAGATEQSFTRRDGNRKPLTVRRARGSV